MTSTERLTPVPVHHRPGCAEPGWTVERSRSMYGVEIARCRGCQAVSVTARSTTTPTLADRNSPSGTNQLKGTK